MKATIRLLELAESITIRLSHLMKVQPIETRWI